MIRWLFFDNLYFWSPVMIVVAVGAVLWGLVVEGWNKFRGRK